jgi:hypothetical protein
MSNDGARLTGKALITRMQQFLDANAAARSSLKVTSMHGRRASVHVIRCNLHEQYLEAIDNEGIIAHMQNEHNLVALFLHEVLDPNTPASINSRTEGGIEIDVYITDRPTEVKTARDVDASDMPDIVHRWYGDMVDNQGDKKAWWFVHFAYRGDANADIGNCCLYYMVATAIVTRDIDINDEQAIISEVMDLIKNAEKKVKEEDGILEGALLPVQDVVHADRLRKKLKVKDVALEKKDAAIKEKDAAIKEKDALIDHQANEIAKLKRQLAKQ